MKQRALSPGIRPVQRISLQGAAQICHVDPDLMGASLFQFQLKEGFFLPFFSQTLSTR